MAATFGTRSLSLSTAEAGAVADHNFSLTLVTASSVGSISFEYCQESPLFDYTCTSPDGLDLSSLNLTAQSGETGFSIGSVTANSVILTRSASVVTPGLSTYYFSNVTNPSEANTSSFVRIATYASTNGSGSRIDEGGMAFSTTGPVNVQAEVPPFLTLCSGVTVDVDCTTIIGNSIDLGELSSSQVNAATSQFAVATNDYSGYNVYVLGNTMTSGVHTIGANNAQALSIPGSSQFGLNLVANTDPLLGSASDGPGTGLVSNNYNDSNLFKFQSGDLISGSIASTDFNRFTITYVVNIPVSQHGGVYSSNLTIMATASF